jgi:hypothetical protein
MIQVERQLPGPVTVQFMAPPGQGTHVSQRVRRAKCLEPLLDLLSPYEPVPFQ